MYSTHFDLFELVSLKNVVNEVYQKNVHVNEFLDLLCSSCSSDSDVSGSSPTFPLKKDVLQSETQNSTTLPSLYRITFNNVSCHLKILLFLSSEKDRELTAKQPTPEGTLERLLNETQAQPILPMWDL